MSLFLFLSEPPQSGLPAPHCIGSAPVQIPVASPWQNPGVSSVCLHWRSSQHRTVGHHSPCCCAPLFFSSFSGTFFLGLLCWFFLFSQTLVPQAQPPVLVSLSTHSPGPSYPTHCFTPTTSMPMTPNPIPPAWTSNAQLSLGQPPAPHRQRQLEPIRCQCYSHSCNFL